MHDFDTEKEFAREFQVTKAPTIVVAARDGYRIENLGNQFPGIPAGHEFSTLINDIPMVYGRDSGLNSDTRSFLKTLDKPLHLQVFVTPT